MKILMKWLVIIVILLTLTSCDLLQSIFGSGKTTLKIVNKTAAELDYITWYDYDNTEYKFGNDDVWDYNTLKYKQGLKISSSATLEVEPGDSEVYFCTTFENKVYWTMYTVTVERGDNITCTLTSSESYYQYTP